MIPFQSLIDTFPGPVWIQDSQGHLIWCNDAWYRYTGQKPDNQTFYSYAFHRDDRDNLLLAVIDAARIGGWSTVRARIRARGGLYHWFLVHIVYSPDNHEARWLGWCMEMGMLAGSAIAGNKSIISRAVEAAEMGFWDWNMITGEMSWDERHSEILGIEHEGGPWSFEYFLGLVTADHREMIVQLINDALTKRGKWHAQCRISQPGGVERWVSIQGIVANMSGAYGLRMVGLIGDITVMRQEEQQWVEFVGIAAHELRTPVTSIKAYSQILLTQLTDDAAPEKLRIVERLVSQADRLSGLVSNLMDATRFGQGELTLNYQWFDLNELAALCVETVKAGDNRHHVILKRGQECWIFADQDRIRQVCLNLLSNAFKYSPDGSTVTIAIWREQEQAGLSVADQGIGIPEEMKAKIFDKFVQVDRQTPAGASGLGLGLYISAGIIRRHGGHIGVESEPGNGSLFYFTIPPGLQDSTHR